MQRTKIKKLPIINFKVYNIKHIMPKYTKNNTGIYVCKVTITHVLIKNRGGLRFYSAGKIL